VPALRGPGLDPRIGDYRVIAGKSLARFATLGLLVLVLGGCAEHGNQANPYGFFSGIWHGLVFPYALAANLVSLVAAQFHYDIFSSITLLGRPNEGLMYYLGFGIGIFAYSGTIATSARIRQ
jgi:hypothetical protein